METRRRRWLRERARQLPFTRSLLNSVMVEWSAECRVRKKTCVASKRLARIMNDIQGQTFRLMTSTLGIVVIDGVKKTLVIPQNATITVDHTIEGEHFVEVHWEGNLVTMYTLDLHARGTRLENAAK